MTIDLALFVLWLGVGLYTLGVAYYWRDAHTALAQRTRRTYGWLGFLTLLACAVAWLTGWLNV